MKKLALFSLLALALSVASAKPPVEGDVLEGNDFVFGVDASLNGVYRNTVTGTPYLYGGGLNGQFITYPTFVQTSSSEDKVVSSQADVNLNLNFRYGILDYVEIFGNANGFYQNSTSPTSGAKSNIVDFSSGNIGLMIALFKTDTFRFIIGDNSDIASNMYFGNHKDINYFGGHTFFLNLIRQKSDGDKFTSGTVQVYYRLNLAKNYTFDGEKGKFKNGDEVGARFLWQFGRESSLGFVQGNVAFRAADRANGKAMIPYYASGTDYSGIGVGFSVGMKKDISAHMGLKVSVDFTSYSIDYNANAVGITIGTYFK